MSNVQLTHKQKDLRIKTLKIKLNNAEKEIAKLKGLLEDKEKIISNIVDAPLLEQKNEVKFTGKLTNAEKRISEDYSDTLF